jgi:delta-aminolevulinic acid dehydratase/porphobilinogen synthase
LILETLELIKRAGADTMLTYFAVEITKLLNKQSAKNN